MEIAKRKKRTREQWQELVLQWETAQMTAKDWCLQHKVSYESFIIWRKRLKSIPRDKMSAPNASFIELLDDPTTPSGVEIHVHSLRLFLSKDFDSSTLLRCLQVLEKLSC